MRPNAVFCPLVAVTFVVALAAESPISWSPRGDGLVYSLPEDQELMVADVHTRQSLLLGKGSDPDWSPVSDQILFVVTNPWPEPPGPVFVIDSDGSAGASPALRLYDLWHQRVVAYRHQVSIFSERWNGDCKRGVGIV